MTEGMADILARLRKEPSFWFATGCFGGPPPSVAAARRDLKKLAGLGLVASKKRGRDTLWRAV